MFEPAFPRHSRGGLFHFAASRRGEFVNYREFASHTRGLRVTAPSSREAIRSDYGAYVFGDISACGVSTHERRNLIPVERADELHAYVGGIARNLGFRLLRAGGTENHLHVLISIPAKFTITTAIQKIKANSSRFLGAKFRWQDGYAVFTVSASQIETVKKYIANQVEHHRKHSFEDELKSLLIRYGLVAPAADAVP